VLWALKLLCRAREEGKIKMEAPVGRGEGAILCQVWANMVSSFEYVEDCNRKILNYGWIEFPLAYTQVPNLALPSCQVATFSVYAYFLAALFGRQFLEPRGDHESVT
jgi:hypothetical protein